MTHGPLLRQLVSRVKLVLQLVKPMRFFDPSNSTNAVSMLS
jgi:hypothetical protein